MTTASIDEVVGRVGLWRAAGRRGLAALRGPDERQLPGRGRRDEVRRADPGRIDRPAGDRSAERARERPCRRRGGSRPGGARAPARSRRHGARVRRRRDDVRGIAAFARDGPPDGRVDPPPPRRALASCSISTCSGPPSDTSGSATSAAFASRTGSRTACRQSSEVEHAMRAHPSPTVPCHNDLLAENYIDDGAKLWLLDYEYSGNNDPTFELANTAQECEFDDDLRAVLCEAYFGSAATTPARAHAAARAHVRHGLDALGGDPGGDLGDRLRLLGLGDATVGARGRDHGLLGFRRPDPDGGSARDGRRTRRADGRPRSDRTVPLVARSGARFRDSERRGDGRGDCDARGGAVRTCRPAPWTRRARLRLLHELREPQGARTRGERSRSARLLLGPARASGAGHRSGLARVGGGVRARTSRADHSEADSVPGPRLRASRSPRGPSSNERLAEIEKRFPDGDPPVPPFWGGYRVAPETIEFWEHRESRLHDRVRYTRLEHGWQIERLAP